MRLRKWLQSLMTASRHPKRQPRTNPSSCIEKLETRYALTGTIQGTIVQDVGGVQVPQAGVVVYATQDSQGVRSASDPSAVTDASGAYSISVPTAGDYFVGVDLLNGGQLLSSRAAIFNETLTPLSLGTAADVLTAVTSLNADSDGFPDLVAVIGNKLRLLKNDGRGNYPASLQSDITLAGGTRPGNVVVGDFNNDGKLDLAAADRAQPKVYVFENLSGKFASPKVFTISSPAYSLAAGNLEGDGAAELVVTHKNGISVLRTPLVAGSSIVKLPSNTDSNLVGAIEDAVIGKFNDDLFNDIAFINSDKGLVGIAHGDGNGNFSATVGHNLGASAGATAAPSSIAAGDFDGDGVSELVVAKRDRDDAGNELNASFVVLSGNLVEQSSFGSSTGPGLLTVELGDLDRDGDLDVILQHGSKAETSKSVEVALYRNEGSLVFDDIKFEGVNFTDINRTRGFAIADLDSDGGIDVAYVTSGTDRRLAFLRNSPVQTVSVFDSATSAVDLEVKLPNLPATPANVTLSLTSPNSVNEDSSGTLKFRITRTGGNLAEQLDLAVAFEGSASSVTDFSQTGATMSSAMLGVVSFAPGKTQVDVVVKPTRDTTIEQNETVQLRLLTSRGYSINGTAVATGTITNDDVARISLKAARNFEGSSLRFVVTLDKPVSEDIQLTATTSDGTATAGTHYTALNSQSVSISSGQLSQTIEVSTESIGTEIGTSEPLTLQLTLSNLQVFGLPVAFTPANGVNPASLSTTGSILKNLGKVTTIRLEETTVFGDIRITNGRLIITDISGVGHNDNLDVSFNASQQTLTIKDPVNTLRSSLGTEIKTNGITHEVRIFLAEIPDSLRGRFQSTPGRALLFELNEGDDKAKLSGISGSPFTEVIVKGGAGSDSIIGTKGADQLQGGEGNDTLQGDDGADILIGDSGNDQLDGGNGNDTLTGAAGDDRFNGGGGTNELQESILGNASLTNRQLFGNGTDTQTSIQRVRLFGSGDANILDAGAYSGTAILIGNSGNDLLIGGSGNDSLQGGEGIDDLRGGDGKDTLFEDDLENAVLSDAMFKADFEEIGDSVLSIELARLTAGSFFIGGARLDASLFSNPVTLIGGTGSDTLLGGLKGDLLQGDHGFDELTGGSGDDTLEGGTGNDCLHGDAGNDRLLGQAGDDTLRGGMGEDLLSGGSDHDVLAGENGNDSLIGGDGNDILAGADGDDVLVGDSIGDVITHTPQGIKGTANFLQTSVLQTRRIGIGNDTLLGGAGADKLFGRLGGPGAIEFFGGADSDILSGDEGNDTLEGESDADELFGGNGIDNLGSRIDDTPTALDQDRVFVPNFDFQALLAACDLLS